MKVVIPAGLPAGDYLVSWRWDCECVLQPARDSLQLQWDHLV